MAAPTEDEQKIFGFVLPPGVDGELVRQSVLTYLALAFLITIFIFFVAPRFADLVIVSNRVASLSTREDVLNGTRVALDTFRTSVDSSSLDAVFLAVPAKYDPGLILLSLRKLASDNKVGLTSYNLAGGKISEDASVLPENQLNRNDVLVEISGPPPSLINFVDSLDKYLPLVSVSNLSISEVSKLLLEGGADLKLEMKLTYYNMPVMVGPDETLSGKLLTEADLTLTRALSLYSRLGSAPSPGAGTVPQGGGKELLFGF